MRILIDDISIPRTIRNEFVQDRLWYTLRPTHRRLVDSSVLRNRVPGRLRNLPRNLQLCGNFDLFVYSELVLSAGWSSEFVRVARDPAGGCTTARIDHTRETRAVETREQKEKLCNTSPTNLGQNDSPPCCIGTGK